MMKHSLKLVFAIAVSVFLLSIGASAQAQEKKFILKLAHADSVDPAVSRKAVMTDVFVKEVKAKSNGRIDVQVFGAGALGGEQDYVEQVKNGFVQAGLASGVMANFYPNAMVTDIPYLFPTEAIADRVMDGPFGQKLAADFLANTGMRNLCFGEVGFRHFTQRQDAHPFAEGFGRPEDPCPGDAHLHHGNEGARCPADAGIPWPETYTALQTGVIDGHENVIPSIIFWQDL